MRKLLIASVFINILLAGYIIKVTVKPEKPVIVPIETVTNIQPDTVTYYLGRNEVFEKLPDTEDEIILVGNSLTHNFEWHEMFRDVNIINRGIGSDITRGVIQRLNEILKSKPRKLFLEIGINDIARDYPMDSIFSNYIKIIQITQIESPETKIYLQSVLPCKEIWNSSILEINRRIEKYSEQNGLTYIDLYTKFVKGAILSPEFDCGDNVHLNGNGYQLWCRSINEYIYE